MNRRRTVMLGLVLGAALVVASCDDGRGDSAASPPASSEPAAGDRAAIAAVGGDPAAGANSVASGTDDGVLTIGVLLPRSGPGTYIGQPGFAAVDRAIAEIDGAGGVFDEPVRVVKFDEGDSTETAMQSIGALVEANVDAVVGPASSTVAAAVLPDLTAAGLVTCSPTASAMMLDDYPNRELFFRTIPSDSLFAHAIAQLVVSTGIESAQIAYMDDAFGRPLAQIVIDDLNESPVEVVAEIPLGSDDDDLVEDVHQLAENPDSVVVVIADSDRGWALIETMSDQLVTYPPRILINDAMKIPPSNAVVTDLPDELRSRIEGLSPLGLPIRDDSGEPVGPFATNSYNCVNLIALAATNAGSDDPLSIAREMVSVSDVGGQCHTFSECVGLLDQNRIIDYQGPGPTLDLSDRGDPRRGMYAIFAYDREGLAFHRTNITVTDPDA